MITGVFQTRLRFKVLISRFIMGYPKHWKELAKTAKEKAGWRCSKCGLICLRPGEKPNTTKPRAYNLQVHHWNRDFPSFLIAVI